jgi:hypothetical protein
MNTISGFRRDVDVICAVVGCYAALSGSLLPTFRDLPVQSSRVRKSKKNAFLDFLTLEDGTHRLSRKVSTEISLNAA